MPENSPATATPARAQPRVLLSVEQAAERLSIGRTLMWSLLKSEAVQSIHVGRLRRVPADALTDYVHQLTEAQRTAPA